MKSGRKRKEKEKNLELVGRPKQATQGRYKNTSKKIILIISL